MYIYSYIYIYIYIIYIYAYIYNIRMNIYIYIIDIQCEQLRLVNQTRADGWDFHQFVSTSHFFGSAHKQQARNKGHPNSVKTCQNIDLQRWWGWERDSQDLPVLVAWSPGKAVLSGFYPSTDFGRSTRCWVQRKAYKKVEFFALNSDGGFRSADRWLGWLRPAGCYSGSGGWWSTRVPSKSTCHWEAMEDWIQWFNQFNDPTGILPMENGGKAE